MNQFGARLKTAINDVMIVGALLFVVAAGNFAWTVSQKHYPTTAAQQAYAVEFCVAQQHGVLAEAWVSKPDMFGTSGTSPRLTIRCGFGAKAYMLKTVDLASANATPH